MALVGESLRQLRNIPASASWYTHDQSSGQVSILGAFFDYRGARGGRNRLSDSSRMALALTSACCELGTGKVFVLQPCNTSLSPTQTALVEARMAFSRVPSLFFIPATWSDEEKTRWTAMEPFHRLELLTARYGLVAPHQSVLPIDIELLSKDTPVPALSGMKTAPATIIIASAPYVGSTQAMRMRCGRIDEESLQFRCSSGWAKFQQWRKSDGLAGVVRELVSMYNNESSMLTFLGSLQGRLIQASMTAAQAGEAYFLRVEGKADLDEEESEEELEGSEGSEQ